jgi:hypothetical protein
MECRIKDCEAIHKECMAYGMKFADCFDLLRPSLSKHDDDVLDLQIWIIILYWSKYIMMYSRIADLIWLLVYRYCTYR